MDREAMDDVVAHRRVELQASAGDSIERISATVLLTSTIHNRLTLFTFLQTWRNLSISTGRYTALSQIPY